MISPSHDRSTKVLARITALLLVAAALAVCLAPASAFASYRQTYGFFGKWSIQTGGLPPAFAAHGMAIGDDGNLWVASHNNYVAALHTDGTVANWIGDDLTNIFGVQGFEQIDNVAMLGNQVWVVDTNRGVSRITTADAFDDIAITTVPARGALNLPDGIAVDASGSVYIGDRGSSEGYSFRVSKFNSAGAYITTFGDVSPTGPSTLQSTGGIAVARDFTVYVADWQAGKVRRYTPNASRTAYTLTASWQSDLFENPASVSVDAAGNVFVLDTEAGTITKLAPSGTVLAHWGGLGTGNGVFVTPWSIVAAPDGSVYVDDRDAATIQRFVPVDLGPTTSASANLIVKKGKKVTFKFMATDDWSPTCSVTIKVFKGSSLKATIACGSGASAAWRTKAWTCKLPKATYTWKVYATDTTGHSQRNVASKTLKVN